MPTSLSNSFSSFMLFAFMNASLKPRSTFAALAALSRRAYMLKLHSPQSSSPRSSSHWYTPLSMVQLSGMSSLTPTTVILLSPATKVLPTAFAVPNIFSAVPRLMMTLPEENDQSLLLP